MANDNHEYYNSEEICTYTDAITISNTLTEEQVNAAVLSAGVPYEAANAWIKVETSTALDEPNSNNPFENGPSGVAVIHNTSELIEIPVTNYERYYHVIYRAESAVATALSVKKYRNVLTITPRTTTIGAATVNFYEWAITTQYGSNNDWTNSALSPHRVINVSGDLSTIPMSGHHDQIFGQSEFSGLGGRIVIGKYISALSAMNGSTTTPVNAPYIAADDWDYALQSQTDYHVVHNTYYDKWVIGNDQGGGGGFHAHGLILITSINFILMQCALCGLKFHYDGTDYKPIVNGGVVTGYTSDMSEESEWDEWENIGDHIIPVDPTPPTPPTPDNPWDVDPETYGWSGGEVSGMVKYYLLTAGQMSLLQTAIASNANWTIDYLNCIVSCFVVPNNGIFFDAPIPTTVKFKLDNATEWDTGVGCARIQGTKNKSGGTIEIPRLTNTFYDFEPYSDYSVYIPFCGRVPIKGNVCLGREIKVTYYPDVPTCSLTAVVSCGGATIAIAKGSFGTMTPVTSNGSDRKTAAVIGDVAPIITGIGTGIVGVALGNPLIVGAGAAQALGGIMGGVKETVQSYAYSVGSTGDSSFFGAGNRCYYYANYPLIDEVVNNSMFGHSVGYLCNTVGKLSSFTGFTICANPHVTFSATSEEREEIERLLSMGVIL